MIKKKKASLHNDTLLFQQLQGAYKEGKNCTSEYWMDYVNKIKRIINKDGLSGFGSNYDLTYAFGDAMKFEVPRYRVRKLVRIPTVYKLIEKYSVVYRFEKIRKRAFNSYKKMFKELDFISYVSSELDADTKSLEVRMSIPIEGKQIPRRYFFYLTYLEMLRDILENKNENLSLKDLFDGNYMDIGGGYGSTVDIISLYKKFHDVGEGSVNYLLDQFPVSFIANQYLKFRDEQAVLSPIFGNSESMDTTVEGVSGHSSFRVIQNDSVDSLSDLKVKYFFNANSFQEMDDGQVINYCEFIKTNKSKQAFLGAFLYNSNEERNSPKRVLDILGSNFELIGQVDSIDFLEMRDITYRDAILDGSYYLFEL